jgi:hypothetical protein
MHGRCVQSAANRSPATGYLRTEASQPLHIDWKQSKTNVMKLDTDAESEETIHGRQFFSGLLVLSQSLCLILAPYPQSIVS